MRALLEIRSGPQLGQKLAVEPGRELRVGRTQPAEAVILGDETLSRVHFSVAVEDERCLVTDLASAGGTQLDGQAIERAAARHGSHLRAGSTDFVLYHAGFTDAFEAALDDDDPLHERKDEALRILAAQPGPLYLLLDAARDPRALSIVRDSVEPAVSLFGGQAALQMAEQAPYLIPLPTDSRLLRRLVRFGWGDSWGVYLTTARPLAPLREHLRSLLLVTVAEGEEPLYFRYYDPRVLRTFVPSCSRRQAEELFGEIDSFVLEGEGAEVLTLRPPQEAAP